jgi:hypothetical protein
MAVLLLEMAYESKEVKESNPNITASIKKLVRWLRAMQHNNPIAAEAYKVVWKILKACASHLQPQVDEILAFDQETTLNPSDILQYHPDNIADEATVPWLEGDLEYNPINAAEVVGPQLFQYPPLNDRPNFNTGINLGTYYPHDELLTPLPFINPFSTSFDQGAPIVDMQDLWSAAEPANLYDPTFADMNMYFAEPDPHTGFTPPE